MEYIIKKLQAGSTPAGIVDMWDAPTGYTAAKATNGCDGCDLGCANTCGQQHRCMSNRKDGKSVIFRAITSTVAAIAPPGTGTAPIQLLRARVEVAEGWREWMDKIPAVRFPSGATVQVLPPFGGALVRYKVRYGGREASVYLDVNNSLGFMDAPYWEVYPVHDAAVRCPLDDTKTLLRLITQSLVDG